MATLVVFIMSYMVAEYQILRLPMTFQIFSEFADCMRKCILLSESTISSSPSVFLMAVNYYRCCSSPDAWVAFTFLKEVLWCENQKLIYLYISSRDKVRQIIVYSIMPEYLTQMQSPSSSNVIIL